MRIESRARCVPKFILSRMPPERFEKRVEVYPVDIGLATQDMPYVMTAWLCIWPMQTRNAKTLY